MARHLGAIMRPIEESKLRNLFRGCSPGDDVAFLHQLLNWHLGPPDDQLPVSGSGAPDFGPRTQAKVKRFQEVNQIDIGTPSFKDGIVGPHTWTKLLEKQVVSLSLRGHPLPIPPLMRPLPPILPPLVLPPLSLPRLSPLPFPVLKPKLEFSIQFQAGEEKSLPFGEKVEAAHSLEIVGVILNKNNEKRTHLEGQIGPALKLNRGGKPDDSKTDLEFDATLNIANMPGSVGRFTWSIEAQLALIKSLNQRSPASAQASVKVAAEVTLFKLGDSVQAISQAGLYLQAEAPNSENGDRWDVKAGAVTFLGLSGTFVSF